MLHILFAWNHKNEILKKEKNLKVNGFLMFLYKNKIVITGGSGRFGKIVKQNAHRFKYNFFFQKKVKYFKNYFDKKYLLNKKPKYLFHLEVYQDPWRFTIKIFPKVLIKI